MSIGVQNTSAALLALQALNRLNESSQAGDSGQTTQSGAATAAGGASASTPSVITGSNGQGLSVDALGAASANLDRAASISDAALSAGQSVSDLLSQMKTLASQAQGGSVSGADANSSFSGLLQQLSATVASAGFDGVNLLDGSTGASVTLGSGGGGQVTLAAANLSLGGPVIGLDATTTLSTQTAAAGVLSSIDASLSNLGSALDQIAGQSRQISAHAGFVSRLSAAVAQSDTSSSTPTSADGARLMALQVQQQLSAQGGAIASASPNVILSLFR
jgi:flagellin